IYSIFFSYNHIDAHPVAVRQNAISAMAVQTPVTGIDSQLVFSKALRLVDGVVASGGSRYEANMIALYEFKTGEGNIAYDTSGVRSEEHTSELQSRENLVC